MTECDAIVIVMDMVSTKKTNIATKTTNTLATNVTTTTSINCCGKESKRLLYFTYSFISDQITIDNYNYLPLYTTKRYNIK